MDLGPWWYLWRAPIFFSKTYQEISLRPSRGKSMNQWKSAEKLMGPEQVWVLCTQVVRFFALRFQGLPRAFCGKKHIAREFCVVFWGGNAKAWVASPQKRAELNADKKALQPIKCYCPNDARLFPVTSGSTVKCCNGFELWGGLKIADSTRPTICGYTFAGRASRVRVACYVKTKLRVGLRVLHQHFA